MSATTLTHDLLTNHASSGLPEPGDELALSIDQTLTQDATGTLVMLELEAIGLDRVQTEASVQYVDHNLIQEDYRNPDDHLFLRSACRRFGVWFSRAGNGVSHPLHMERFGEPGKTLVGSDSHTPAAGALGMFAVGAGGIEVAMAMAGEPLRIPMPEVWGVRLVGEPPDWVSAKDVILELLRRHGVRGGVGRVIEYHGPGLEHLSVWDRHVIANMGTELGATTSVFPSDEHVRAFLEGQGRGDTWRPLAADEGATWDVEEELDLSALVPLIARPSSPGDVVPVAEVAGEPIYQAYIGSSANPGFRDFAVAAEMVAGRRVADSVSLDINPASRTILRDLVRTSHLDRLLSAGARLHQCGCNGCIGMGQAPATGRNSLRTVPRNFPGRSGTPEDAVWLCSPETATASALTGRITDPRELDMPYPDVRVPDEPAVDPEMFEPPRPRGDAANVDLVRGPNIAALPKLEPLPNVLSVPVLLVVGDDISTDGILPAGSRVLPFRSNIPRIAEFAFEGIDPEYVDRTRGVRDGHAIVAGANYGQGSSREHAALAPRTLGLRVVIARSFARIHHQNLVNFGVLPLTVEQPNELPEVEIGSQLHLTALRDRLPRESGVPARLDDHRVVLRHHLSPRQVQVCLAGGIVPWLRDRPS